MNTMTDQSAAQTASPGGGPRQFILVGSVRSGTTMLRLMLDHHPELSCMQESGFMVTHYAACASKSMEHYRRALEQDWLWRVSGLEFPKEAGSYAEAVTDFFIQRQRSHHKPVVGATILESFAPLPTLVPDARYVHLLRDGRPVARSIQQMGWAGNLYFGARRWRQTIEEILALQQQIPADRWLEVRYEELLQDPPYHLARICKLLGVAYDEAMLGYEARTTYSLPDATNAHRWRKGLSPREIYLAEMAAGEMLERLGYGRQFPRATPGRLERLALWLHHRYRRTLFRFERYGAYLMLARWMWRRIGVRRKALEARFEAIGQAHIK